MTKNLECTILYIINGGEAMTLQQLKYVIAVAEKGTISEAAKTLFISQPSLTNAIKELENEIQIEIFIRTNKGVILSNDGEEFMGYARQIVEQTALLEDRYINHENHKQKFSVSTQHYSFAVNAFVDVVKKFGYSNYDFTLRETQTNEIILDVSTLKSEIGVLYLSKENSQVINKLLKENNLKFEQIMEAEPHVFISYKHPLAQRETVNLEDLQPYTYLSFEQGRYNSFYFYEEILGNIEREKSIKVRDRATLFNLVVGLDGYTISSGIIDKELNGKQIIAKKLNVNEIMKIGIVTHKKTGLSPIGKEYIEAIKCYGK